MVKTVKWLQFGKVQEKIKKKWFMFKEQFIQIELLSSDTSQQNSITTLSMEKQTNKKKNIRTQSLF